MRKAFLVYVDLDPVPGEMHTQESAQNVLRSILNHMIPAYNPIVSLAPREYQPEVVSAGVEIDLKLPQRAGDYLLEFEKTKPMGDYDNFDRINLTPAAEQERINDRVLKNSIIDRPNMFAVAPGAQNWDDLSDVEKGLYGNPKYLEKIGTIKVTDNAAGLKFDITQSLEERAKLEGLLNEPSAEDLRDTVEYTEGNAGLD